MAITPDLKSATFFNVSPVNKGSKLKQKDEPDGGFALLFQVLAGLIKQDDKPGGSDSIEQDVLLGGALKKNGKRELPEPGGLPGNDIVLKPQVETSVITPPFAGFNAAAESAIPGEKTIRQMPGIKMPALVKPVRHEGQHATNIVPASETAAQTKVKKSIIGVIGESHQAPIIGMVQPVGMEGEPKPGIIPAAAKSQDTIQDSRIPKSTQLRQSIKGHIGRSFQLKSDGPPVDDMTKNSWLNKKIDDAVNRVAQINPSMSTSEQPKSILSTMNVNMTDKIASQIKNDPVLQRGKEVLPVEETGSEQTQKAGSATSTGRYDSARVKQPDFSEVVAMSLSTTADENVSLQSKEKKAGSNKVRSQDTRTEKIQPAVLNKPSAIPGLHLQEKAAQAKESHGAFDPVMKTQTDELDVPEKMNHNNRTAEPFSGLTAAVKAGEAPDKVIGLSPGENAARGNVALEDIAQKTPQFIVKMVKRGETKMRVSISPKSLGYMQIELTNEKDTMHVRFIVGSDEVKNVFDKSLPEIKQAMSDSGVTSGDLSVEISSEFTSRQGQQNRNRRTRQQSSNNQQINNESPEIEKIENRSMRDYGYNSMEVEA